MGFSEHSYSTDNDYKLIEGLRPKEKRRSTFFISRNDEEDGQSKSSESCSNKVIELINFDSQSQIQIEHREDSVRKSGLQTPSKVIHGIPIHKTVGKNQKFYLIL
jgi:hypothetical protein